MPIIRILNPLKDKLARVVQQFVSMGARFVSTGTDLGFLLAACMERVKQVRSFKL